MIFLTSAPGEVAWCHERTAALHGIATSLLPCRSGLQSTPRAVRQSKRHNQKSKGLEPFDVKL
jgi:hypothetical protein